MTPRALLTAIGATAIGFAVVITSVAQSDAGPTPAKQATTSVSVDAARTVAFVPLDAVPVVSPQFSSVHAPGAWTEDCEMAL